MPGPRHLFALAIPLILCGLAAPARATEGPAGVDQIPDALFRRAVEKRRQGDYAAAYQDFQRYLGLVQGPAEQAQAQAQLDELRHKVALVELAYGAGDQHPTVIKVDDRSTTVPARGQLVPIPEGRHTILVSAADPAQDQLALRWERRADFIAGRLYRFDADLREPMTDRFALGVGTQFLILVSGDAPPSQLSPAVSFEYRWPLSRVIAVDLVLRLPVDIPVFSKDPANDWWGAGLFLGGRWVLHLPETPIVKLAIVPTLGLGLTYIRKPGHDPNQPEAGQPKDDLCANVNCTIPALRTQIGVDLSLRIPGGVELRPQIGVVTALAGLQLLAPRMIAGMEVVYRFPPAGRAP